MTPKEKTIELVDKFMLHNSYQSIVWYNAKQCALIAVDEILNELDDIRNFTGSKLSLRMIKYWQEVKQEIEKL
jgi:hypothetical protein